MLCSLSGVSICFLPAGCDVEPHRVLSLFRPAGAFKLRNVKHGQAVVYVTFHIHLSLWLVGVHVHQPRHHVRGEGHDECLEAGKHFALVGLVKNQPSGSDSRFCYALTFVTTDSTAIPLRISSQAPMLWALAATGRLN